MAENSRYYAEMIATIAIPQDSAPGFDLLFGFDSEEMRFRTYDEEHRIHLALRMLRYVPRREVVANAHRDDIARLATVWLQHFPNIEDVLSMDDSSLYKSLWHCILQRSNVLKIAYAFYPMTADSPDGEPIRNRMGATQHKAEEIQRELVRWTGKSSLTRDCVIWTLTFPLVGPLGKVVEGDSGLSEKLSRGDSVLGYPPSLLCSFLTYVMAPLETALNPHQFEDLAAIYFQEHGWQVQRMPKTRDGGKDVVATTYVNGKKHVAYVQAKRYKSNRKVSISEIKAFVETVRGNRADKGFIFTTTHLSRPAAAWLRDKATEVAEFEAIERNELYDWVRMSAYAEPAVWLLTRQSE